MPKFSLSPQAWRDIVLIAEQGIERFGFAQTNLYQEEMDHQFQLLADHPGLGRSINSERFPKARKFGYGIHIIIYSPQDDSILINRIFDGRSDYAKHL